MKTFWKVVLCLILVIFLVVAGVWATYLTYRAAFKFSTLESHIALLESHATAIEWRLQSVEETVSELELRAAALEEENFDLNWSIRWLRQEQDRIYGHFSDSVLIDIDQGIKPEMGLEFLVGGHRYVDFHPSALFKLERPFLVRMGLADWVDLSDELQPGDRLQVWCNPKQPTSGVSFWDDGSCLVLNLQHLDGVYALITR